jgi:hypothetical protein
MKKALQSRGAIISFEMEVKSMLNLDLLQVIFQKNFNAGLIESRFLKQGVRHLPQWRL